MTTSQEFQWGSKWRANSHRYLFQEFIWYVQVAASSTRIDITAVFFHLLFGCPTTSSGPLLRGQPHSVDLNLFIILVSIKKVWSLSLVEHLVGFEHRGGIAGLPLLRTLVVFCQKSCETSSWEVMYSCFISVNKFGSFKNLFETINSLSELQFRCRRFILLV